MVSEVKELIKSKFYQSIHNLEVMYKNIGLCYNISDFNKVMFNKSKNYFQCIEDRHLLPPITAINDAINSINAVRKQLPQIKLTSNKLLDENIANQYLYREVEQLYCIKNLYEKYKL